MNPGKNQINFLSKQIIALCLSTVIIITGFIHPRMTCYPKNINIWIGNKHGPCGLKIKCNKCSEECKNHNPDIIIKKIKEKLEI